MALLRARVVLVGSVVVAAIGGVPSGCGGTLVGDAGSGGTTGSGGASGSGGAEPACGPMVGRGVFCGPEDQQLCYKRCGPEGVGVKEVTCGPIPGSAAPVYREPSECPYDQAADYSCYRIPAVANADCPAGVPTDSMDCGTVPRCVVCNSSGGLMGGQYNNTTGAHPGFCVCQLPNAAGLRTWSCVSDWAWPCPLLSGC